MKFSVSMIILSFAGAIYASALPDAGPAGLVARTILPRQAGGLGNSSAPETIPSQCTDRCAVLDEIATCNEAAGVNCPCSTDKASRYADCMRCVLATHDTDDYEDLLQDTYDFYRSTCIAAGVQVNDEDIDDDDDNDSASQLSVSVGALSLVALSFATLL